MIEELITMVFVVAVWIFDRQWVIQVGYLIFKSTYIYSIQMYSINSSSFGRLGCSYKTFARYYTVASNCRGRLVNYEQLWLDGSCCCFGAVKPTSIGYFWRVSKSSSRFVHTGVYQYLRSMCWFFFMYICTYVSNFLMSNSINVCRTNTWILLMHCVRDQEKFNIISSLMRWFIDAWWRNGTQNLVYLSFCLSAKGRYIFMYVCMYVKYVCMYR